MNWVILCLFFGSTIANDPFDPNNLKGEEPSKPLGLKIVNTTATEIYLTWKKPEFENGDIRGYRVYFLQDNHTDVRNSLSTSPGYSLSSLKPDTEYKIWIKAFTMKFEGQLSDSVMHRTDVAGPSMPIITNASCQSNASLYIEWIKPVLSRVNVVEYTVNFKPQYADDFEERIVTPNGTGPYSLLLTDLDPDTIYEVYVFGSSRSNYNPEKLLPGEVSDLRQVFIKSECEKIEPPIFDMYPEFTPGLLSVIGGVGAVVVILCFFCAWRKCFKQRFSLVISGRRRPGGWERNKETMITMQDFPLHVAKMHTDGDLGFSKEYEAIQHSVLNDQLTAIVSQHPENKLKNRYLNILAYDHTRVKFLPVPGQENSATEYINANFIDGFQKRSAYIGTQGPLPVTFAAFWRMVWEQQVSIIVMITNLIERGRRKCDMYWPKEDTDTHGQISITMEKEDVKATYTVRTFRIRCVRQDKKKKSLPERIVYQYHYTNWPDHGTPDHALPILRFITKSSSANPPDGGPIVVHCSAGVGRTGAYIVLDTMLKMIKANKEVDVYSFLKHIRTQRNFLVQTEEQYIFIHDALVEAIESGDTNIHQTYTSRYLNSMVAGGDHSVPGHQLENQFKLVTSFKPMEYHSVSARKSMNIPKNGANPIVPMECFRVHLTPKPGFEGSDYVNASWFMGYHRLHEYIVAGAPCDYSLVDFWQMLWDHSVRTIAIFIDFENEDVPPFWPSEGQFISGDTYKFVLLQEGEANGAIFRDFCLRASSEEYEWTVRAWFFPSWPHSNIPFIKVFDAVNQVLEHNKTNHNGPIALIDRFGTTQAATFCVLASVLHQLKEESYADIYTFAKLYHLCRPGCWGSSTDLLFLYEAVSALAKSLPPTSVPTVAPYPPGTGPTPNITLNGKSVAYIRCRGNSASLDSIEDGLVTPEMESIFPSALQETLLADQASEVRLNVEMVENELPEAGEGDEVDVDDDDDDEDEEEEGVAEDVV